MTRITGIEMAEQFSNFINSSTNSEREEFARHMVSDHRTLQEDSFLTFYHAVRIWAECYDKDIYDARNEYTVKASKAMVEGLKAKGLW